MFKKTITFLLLLILSLLMFRCSKKVEVPKKEVFFLIRGTPDELALWKKAIESFESENKDIKVKLEHVPYNAYWSKIETMIAGGVAPDVIFLESTRIVSFIKLNALESLDEYIKEDKEFNKENFYPQAINAYIYDNKIYGIPNDIAIYAIYYNKDLFDKLGVKYPTSDWTWSDFLEKCKALTIDENKDGITDVYGFNIGWTYYLWIWQNGGDFFDNPTNPKKVIINSENSKEALQFLKDLMYRYKVAPTFAQSSSFGGAQEMFMTGRVAMIIEGHWMVPQFKNITTFKWDVAELPKGKIKANYNTGSCFSIPKLAKNKNEAWRLIKFLAGEKGQKILISGGFSTPALKTEEITKLFLNSTPPENNKVFIDMIKYSHLPPMIPEFNEMSDMMYRELDYLWLNKKNVDVVLKNIEKELKKFIK